MDNNTQHYKQNVKKHKTFLKKFQLFPDKTRKAIYKQLLLLPLNHQHFKELTKSYPILPQHGLNKQVAFITWALSALYPQLKNQWIPGIIHPFVKLFQEDSIFAFECSLTFLLNWLHPFLVDYPNPSSQVMEIFSNYLPNLQAKVNQLDYPISAIIHPMFAVTLTDVLNRQNWLQLFDFLVTNAFKPWYLICFSLALVKCVENKLIKLNSVEEIALALRKEKNIALNSLFGQIPAIEDRYQEKFEQMYKNSYFPIKSGRYPVFKFIKDKIRMEHEKLNHNEEEEIKQISNQYQQLESFVNKNIRTGQVSDQRQISDKYQMVEGQMRQYIEKVKKEHGRKIQALREIQRNFKQQIKNQGDKRHPSLPIEAIERRAQLEKEILRLNQEADSIKKMEDEMMERINNEVQIKRNELITQNRKLRTMKF